MALSSVFIVDERERARWCCSSDRSSKRCPNRAAGLGFKVPFIQEVVTYEDRILGLPTQPIEVTPSDDRRLVVDAFARWRITNLVEFREAVGAGGEAQARMRLDSIITRRPSARCWARCRQLRFCPKIASR